MEKCGYIHKMITKSPHYTLVIISCKKYGIELASRITIGSQTVGYRDYSICRKCKHKIRGLDKYVEV